MKKKFFWKKTTHRASLGGLLERPVLVSRRPAARGHNYWVRYLKRVHLLLHQILPQEVLNGAVYPSVQSKEYSRCNLSICVYVFFGRTRVCCWPLLCLCRPLMIFRDVWIRTHRACRERPARYQLRHPPLFSVAQCILRFKLRKIQLMWLNYL